MLLICEIWRDHPVIVGWAFGRYRGNSLGKDAVSDGCLPFFLQLFYIVYQPCVAINLDLILFLNFFLTLLSTILLLVDSFVNFGDVCRRFLALLHAFV